MKPLLQIVHVSDMHLAKRNSLKGRAVAEFLSGLPVIGLRIKQGLAGHDPAALKAFEASLIRVIKSKPSWLERTIVVATGDFSTWGEDNYGMAAVNYLKRAAQRASYAAFEQLKADAQKAQPQVQPPKHFRLIPVLPIYGNHDVWPEGFPLAFSNEELDQRRTNLRLHPPFQEHRPVQMYSTGKDGGTSPPITLWALDTVLHDPIDNALAFGKIQQDWYWDPRGLSHQVTELQQRSQFPQIRIALTHHPIAGQDHVFPISHVLREASSVASQLQQPDPHTPDWPLVRIVLSGHTHKLYPSLGALPASPPTEQSPLGQNQLQLTIGTLSQKRWNRSKQEQCWQLLRLYSEDYPADNSGQQKCTLHLERTVLYRSNNAGDFTIRVPQNGDRKMTSERFSFEIAIPSKT
jgi:hypothetical protein